MIIKKFTSKTEHEAILMAKEDLGSEAIVMNIKKIKPKGIFKLFVKTKVEVTAAIDDTKSYESKSYETSTHESTIFKKPEIKKPDIIRPDMIQNNKEEDASHNKTTAIEKKLDTLQSLIEQKISLQEEKKDGREEASSSQTDQTQEDKEQDKLEACKQLIYEQLVQNDMDSNYAKQLLDEIQNTLTSDSSIDVILGNVYQKIILKLGQAKTIDTEKIEKKFIFFVGPTGVGKTTTIAKLSSNLKLNKKLNIALVTADTYRIAAVEQLKTYANILGIPLKVVYSAMEFKDMMEELLEFDMVLVDTAGHSHCNNEHSDDLKELLNSVEEEQREVFLVLSTTTKYRDLCEITKIYNQMTKYCLLFTKLDETVSIGNIYNIRVLTNAPLSYTTYGQNVPDDIEKIDPQNVAKKLLGGNA